MLKQFFNSSILTILMKKYFLLIIIYLNLSLIQCFSRLSANPIHKSSANKCPSIALPSEESGFGFNHISDELQKELKLFALNKSELLWKRRRHNIPPQYILDLYSMVSNTDNQNINQNNMKYNSKTIRGVSHSDTSETSTHLHFYFNLSQLIPTNEHIIEAEFHIYKLRSQLKHTKHLDRSEDPKHNLLEVKVYQILSKDNKSENRLLDVRRMSTHSFGWDVFYVKQAVLDWVHNHTTNYGLIITVKTLLNEDMKNGIRFANRYRNHLNKQPMIVIFTSDHKLNASVVKQNQLNSKYDYGFSELNDNNNKEEMESKEFSSSHIRANDSSKGMSTSSGLSLSSYETQICYRRQIYIDFESIGWSASVIAPKGYTTSICEQKCINPVNQNIFAKSDTTSRNASPLDQLNVVKRCCIANKFNALYVLYFDERGNVVLKRLDGLVVNSCAAQLCH